MPQVTRKAPVMHQELLGYLRGDLTEELVRIKLSGQLPQTQSVIDGHDPFEAPNFGRQDGMLPKNLDAVIIDKDTGEVVAIYEVKSTTTDKKEFHVNGQCGIFMSLARASSIPIYLVVVRLDREMRPDLLSTDPITKEPHLDERVYQSEVAHFLQSAKFELYSEGQFEMRNGQFVITGGFRYL